MSPLRVTRDPSHSPRRPSTHYERRERLCMAVRRVIKSMLSSSLHAALGAPAACRVARAVRPAAAASPNARASGGSFAPRRGLAVTAASAWRDASELADLLERRHGVGHVV